MARNRDLFDDTTMTFGEHLEVLRVHVWRSLIGVTLGVIICLLFGDKIIGVLREPINAALRRSDATEDVVQDDVSDVNLIDFIKDYFSGELDGESDRTGSQELAAAPPKDEVVVQIPLTSLKELLRKVAPDVIAEPADLNAEDDPPGVDVEQAEQMVSFPIRAPEFAQFRRTSERFNSPVTFKVEEAFMAYMKVSVIAGFVLASPWVFYQIWLFVAAGLYPHERKYVYVYLPMSLILFASGALFCFYGVFPIVLTF